MVCLFQISTLDCYQVSWGLFFARPMRHLMGIVWERRWRRWWHLELITCPKRLHWQIRISRAQIAWEPESATKLQTQIYRVHERLYLKSSKSSGSYEAQVGSSKHSIFYMHSLMKTDHARWEKVGNEDTLINWNIQQHCACSEPRNGLSAQPFFHA